MYDAVTSATNKKSIKYATSYYKTGVANDEDETKEAMEQFLIRHYMELKK